MKMSMVSLGCDKNTVDSEMMLGLMNDKGFEYTDIDEEAEIMIINTCGFIQSAKEESINAILEAARLKEEGFRGRLFVGYNLSYPDESIEEYNIGDKIIVKSFLNTVLVQNEKY